jgi:hypothetical protein
MRPLCLVLLTGMILQIWSKPVIFMQYLANIGYIEKTLCINRDDPAKECHGKCHLKKQLDRDNAQHKDQQIKTQAGTDLISGAFQTNLVPVPAMIKTGSFISAVNHLPTGIAPGIFHPPG